MLNINTNVNDIVNRKSNVLGKIIIPRTDKTIRYILSELEELEREEFFRLKKVLEVKYRHKKKKKAADEERPVEEKPRQKPGKSASQPLPKKSSFAKVPSNQTIPEEFDCCMLCERPLHSEDQPLTAEQIKEEKAAIAELNEKLSKVLDATEAYEKTTSQQDDLKEFKKTTSDLREKLRAMSSKSITIPDNIDISNLCDRCKEIYKEKRSETKCVVCGEPLAGKADKKLAVAKESKKQLQQQLGTVLSAIRDYESQGLADDRIKHFKETAADLKEKLKGPPIPPNVDVSKLCDACKQRYNEPDEPEPVSTSKSPKMKESKVSIKEPSPKISEQEARQEPSQEPPDLALGVFETEEITEIVQVRNPDGTVTEKRRIITIVRKPGGSTSRGPSSTTFKDKKNVGLVSVIHPKKRLADRLPRDVQSDHSLSQLRMTERLVRACVSSSFDLGFEEVLESVTELIPDDTKDSSHVLLITASSEFERSLNYSESTCFGESVILETLEPRDDSTDDIKLGLKKPSESTDHQNQPRDRN